MSEIQIKDHNAKDKVQQRGYEMTGPVEYTILKVEDEGRVYNVFCDRYFTKANKEALLGLKDKICLFKLGKENKDGLLKSDRFKELT